MEEEARVHSIIGLPGLFLLGTVIGCGAACAQSTGPDEAIGPDSKMAQNLALTAVQKQAIHDAVFQQEVKPYIRATPDNGTLAASVGAPVPQSADLAGLPDTATANDPWATDLKYGMADSDVIVIVDPVLMRVVDVIRSGAAP
jgi:hypothetical protein